ncbi:MAG: hypothetical protein WA208_05375, partial [Thermoanaerobaculia bacterium]
MSFIRPFIPFLVVVSLFAGELRAQVTGPPVASVEIVVTASAIPEEARSTPASATILTRSDIELRAARD